MISVSFHHCFHIIDKLASGFKMPIFIHHKDSEPIAFDKKLI